MNIEDPSDNKYFTRGSISFEVARPTKKRKYLIGILILCSVCAIVLLLFLLLHHSHNQNFASGPEEAFYRYSTLKEFKDGSGAVCSDGTPCSEIGRNVLRKSGSAIDGAIASAFCNGLYTMQSMGIGGGFQMIYYRKRTKEVFSITAREVAPLKATKDMFNGTASSSKTGGLACAVPGELKGYLEAHNRFGGKISWREIIQPTYKMCLNGYKMSRHQRDSIYERFNDIKSDPTLRSMFIDEGKNASKPIGTTIKPPNEFCDTLKKIMDEGPDTFYNGSLADDFVQDVQELGGIITKEDLVTYKVKIEEPVKVTLKSGHNVYSAPLPGSGVLLGFILKVLDGFNFKPSDKTDLKSTTILTQRIVETFKHAFAFRTELGDIPMDGSEDAERVKELVSKLISDEDFAEKVRNSIRTNKTSNKFQDYGEGAIYYNPDADGTAHMSVIAPNGDAVSLTSSVNVFFGAARIGRRTGILLNDGMDDFSNAGYSNYFGLKPSPANFIVPGRSALSSVTPTIIINKDDSVRMVLGAAGGPKITTATVLVILRHLWLEENIKEAIDAKRIHHQLQPMKLQYERGFSKDVIEELKIIGHDVQEFSVRGSVICAIIKDNNNNIYGNADFRKDGDVCGFHPNDNKTGDGC